MHALRRSPQPANPASQASERASSYACLCACASSVYFTCTYARMLDERSRYIIYIYMYMYMCIRSFYGKESDFLRSTLTPRQERRPIEGDRNRDYATEERGGGEDRPSSFLSSSLLFPLTAARFLVADPDAMAGRPLLATSTVSIIAYSSRWCPIEGQ